MIAPTYEDPRLSCRTLLCSLRPTRLIGVYMYTRVFLSESRITQITRRDAGLSLHKLESLRDKERQGAGVSEVALLTPTYEEVSEVALLAPTDEEVCLHKLESLCYKEAGCGGVGGRFDRSDLRRGVFAQTGKFVLRRGEWYSAQTGKADGYIPCFWNRSSNASANKSCILMFSLTESCFN